MEELYTIATIRCPVLKVYLRFKASLVVWKSPRGVVSSYTPVNVVIAGAAHG